jgi:hypothetical protein
LATFDEFWARVDTAQIINSEFVKSQFQLLFSASDGALGGAPLRSLFDIVAGAPIGSPISTLVQAEQWEQ